MRLTIPRRLHLPLGYTVKVQQLEHDDFVESHGRDGLAYWYDEGTGGTIVLDKSRPLTKRFEDFLHELRHVWVDYEEHVRDALTKRKKR